MKVTKTVEKANGVEVQEETSVIPPKYYDALKKFVQVVLPAFAAFYLTLAGTWDFPEPERVVATTTAITAFLGICLGISSKRYAESDEPHSGELVVTRDQGGVKGWMLSLDGDPEQLSDKKSISFRVVENPDYNPAP